MPIADLPAARWRLMAPPRRRPAGFESRRRRLALGWPYLVPAVVLSILYTRTLQRSTGNVFSIDTTKFDYLGLVLGTAHPPGYPLYTMLNAVIVRVVPFGSVAVRANLLSAVCAVLLGVVVVDILLRLRVRPVLAAAGATAIGLIPELWTFAVVAEVYTMTALFVGLVLACVLRFDTSGRRGWLRAGVLILALSFAHATSNVLLIPGLLLYLAMRRVRWLFRLRELAVLLPVSAALALLPYLYLFWRTAAHAAFLDVRVTGLRSFVAVITGARYGKKMFAVPVSQLPGRVVELGHAGWTQFGPFLGLCVLGLLAFAAAPAPTGRRHAGDLGGLHGGVRPLLPGSATGPPCCCRSGWCWDCGPSSGSTPS